MLLRLRGPLIPTARFERSSSVQEYAVNQIFHTTVYENVSLPQYSNLYRFRFPQCYPAQASGFWVF